MKKIFIAIMAVAAAVSCSTELTVDAPKGAAIAFNNLFVENSTRGAVDYDANNLPQDFAVYGTIKNANNEYGVIFNNVEVAKSGDIYSYQNTQYWVAGNNYYFNAFAPYQGAKWSFAMAEDTNANVGTLTFDNEKAAATMDLIYAYNSRENVAANDNTPVALTFNHLLSKVAFKFYNEFDAVSNIKFEVYNVKITNAPSVAEVSVNNNTIGEWAKVGTATFPIAFGKATAEGLVACIANGGSYTVADSYYLLPVESTYEIKFDVDVYQANVKVATYNHTINLNTNLHKNTSYCLSAKLNQENIANTPLNPIEFTVTTVNGWVEAGETVVKPATPVATAAELVAAIAEGDNVLLTQDINLDAVMVSRANTYGLFIEHDCVIDGAGYTITTNASRGIAVSGANDVVLKNFNLVASGERGIQVQGGAKKVTIENVTAVSANYTVSLPSSAGATNVTINNCDLKGLNTVNIGAPGAVVNINNTIIRSEDNNETENYSAIDVNKDAVGATVNVNGGEILVTGTHPNTFGARVQATDGAINISTTTKGNTTLANNYYAVVYGDYWYGFETFEDAYAKAQAGETIVLTQDATIAEGLKVYNNVNFDLNGKTLKYTGNDVLFRVYGATVTINGSKAGSAIETLPTNPGDASAGNGYVGLVLEDGTLNINGGSYDAQGTCTIAQVVKGTLNVNAGTFKVNLDEYTDANGEARYLLNCTDANYKNGTAVVQVYGGSFYKFNPANNVAENPKYNFVAAGKTVEQDGDWYIVK